MLKDSQLILVVDFRYIISTYQSVTGMYSVYQDFPLQDIIQEILSVRPDLEFEGTQRLWQTLEERLGSKLLEFDHNYDAIDLMFDMLMEDLDTHIRTRAPVRHSHKNYVFQRWIRPAMALLYTTDS